jgi:nicotinate phosphoribosyltransferase
MNPDAAVTDLVDYEGCELDVARQAFEVLGKKLFAVRLDTHGGRYHQGVCEDCFCEAGFKEKVGHYCKDLIKDFTKQTGYDPQEVEKYYYGKGVTIEATFLMRRFLDSIGANDVKIVVSSGFNEKKVAAFRHANAPMNFIGTGSWVRFAMFTADITHVMEDGRWVHRGKVGRDHYDGGKLELLYERK